MWITLKHVPHQMYSHEGLKFIASAVGRAIRLHPETELCTSFEEAKVFVEADMTKTLPSVYRFKSKLGIDAQVEFMYLWLPSRCSDCSTWGHESKDCQKTILHRRNVSNPETGEATTKEIMVEDTHSPENKKEPEELEEMEGNHAEKVDKEMEKKAMTQTQTGQ